MFNFRVSGYEFEPDSLIVTNNINFIYNRSCPLCRTKVDITVKGAYCPNCHYYYVSPQNYDPNKMTSPANVSLENGRLFIPKSMIDLTKYNSRKLPRHNDDILYTIHTGELNWLKEYYHENREHIPFNGKPKEKGLLSSEGYNTKCRENERRAILDRLVHEGKIEEVFQRLRFLIEKFAAQKNGLSKYSDSISIWQSDFEYLKKTYPTESKYERNPEF